VTCVSANCDSCVIDSDCLSSHMYCFSDTPDGNSVEKSDGDVRKLQGVMRTGLFASGLMLAGETNVELVLITVDKPTIALLHRVVDCLSAELPVRSLLASLYINID